MSYDDEKEAEYRYCQMVAINKINPDRGWPHYNKSINCDKDKKGENDEPSTRITSPVPAARNQDRGRTEGNGGGERGEDPVVL